MDEKTLRQQVIRLASERAELRGHLLPLLKRSGFMLPVGKPLTNTMGNLRIHRYEHAVRVLDATNGGVRGRTCPVVSLGYLDFLKGRDDLEVKLGELVKCRTFQEARGLLVELNQQFPQTTLDEDELKGVEVNPMGFKPLDIETPEFRLKSDLLTFTIGDKSDTANLPRAIPLRGAKKDIRVLYKWVSDNLAAVKQMTYTELLDKLSDQGIRYREYYAMD